MSETLVVPGGRFVVTRDATLNDSDKTVLTVPAGKKVKLQEFHVSYVASAVVGNRTLTIQYTDGANVIFQKTWGINQPANQTYPYCGYIGANFDVVNAPFSLPLPDVMLLAGYTVRIWDSAAIDAAADDMTTVIQYAQYEA